MSRDSILGSPEKPPVMPVLWQNIPKGLRLLDRWLVWKWIRDVAANGGGKWDKPPINVLTGLPAPITDHFNFETALAAVEAGEADGLGFVLGDIGDGRVVSGIDIDDCRDPLTGELSAEAKVVVAKLRQHYWEISPSGAGLKMLCYGQKPRGRCRNGPYEVYSAGRYFALTGHIPEFGNA